MQPVWVIWLGLVGVITALDYIAGRRWARRNSAQVALRGGDDDFPFGTSLFHGVVFASMLIFVGYVVEDVADVNLLPQGTK